jgi:hypothetical protein
VSISSDTHLQRLEAGSGKSQVHGEIRARCHGASGVLFETSSGKDHKECFIVLTALMKSSFVQ